MGGFSDSGTARLWLPLWIAVVMLSGIGFAVTSAAGELASEGIRASTVLHGNERLRVPRDIDPELRAALQQSEDVHGSASPFTDFSPEQARCIDEEAGMSAAELIDTLSDASEAGLDGIETLFRSVLTCVPDVWSVPSFADTFTRTITAVLGGHTGIDPTEGQCLLRHIVEHSPDPARAIVRGTTPEDIEVLLAGVDACFDDESQRAFSGEAGTGPQRPGDDASFDQLHGLCQDGSDVACDLLFALSTVGSEYRDLATTCAGRGDGVSYCTDGLVADEVGSVRADSPGLEVLRTSCAGADMVACDLLYNVSPLGSALEHFGATCGERIPVKAVPDCRTRFP